MAEQQLQLEEVGRLTGLLLEGALGPEDRRRLEETLLADPAALEYYQDYVDVHCLLHWQHGLPEEREVRGEGREARDEGRGMVGSPAIDLPVGAAVEHPVGAAVELPLPPDLESQIPESRTPNPEPPFPSLSTTHYPLPTSHFSVGSWAFSYMVATVVMGVAILGFWAYKITHHQPQVAEAPSKLYPLHDRPEMVFVGRITGMVDVKWSDDPRYLPPPGFAHVSLGREYRLDAGLLEITYDSGAKVILEGPCTYEVESTAGGYLALGKLTARVETRGEGRGAREEKGSRFKVQGSSSKPEPSSFILHPSSLFSVRTPTAVITDLGTEFGVEVKKSGDSLTHVFKGKVEVRLAGPGKEKVSAIQLTENESVRVDGNGWERVLDAGNTTDEPKNFVWRIPADTGGSKPSSVKVLAWFRMGDDDPDATVGTVVNEETVDHKGRCKLVRHDKPTYSAGEEFTGGRFSVRFHGLEGEGFFGSDASLVAIRDNYVLEAYVKVHKLPDRPTVIAYNGHTGRDGFGLAVQDGRWKYLFGGIAMFDSGVPVELGKWTHVALVYQWGLAQLWVNGQPIEEPVALWRPYPSEGTFQIGCEQADPRLVIDAEIDEVRLSVLLERFRPEMLLFPASSAPHSLAGEEKGDLPMRRRR